jgi:hypothetical protein
MKTIVFPKKPVRRICCGLIRRGIRHRELATAKGAGSAGLLTFGAVFFEALA